ncbi:hypothetical protein BU24DRAFT_467286 [Aaosphaeria arxii CBS 175.79]|uniref:Uncharacterized protein n=1 Tax=Aaosphaeria arxii CBS 175.79 TaxID=1450172 RepID=A0A6A5XCI8_9PLEO|nr:uncharacterized protein BU24DRAFT_467286 [Aaosphaeria arxii CBS 175.79]KAF2010688.1 hypothetical protein BU24DRAFT_467286 [Aaosphaeria arxii CBS 175.79]
MSIFLAPRSTHFVHIRHLNIFVTPHVIPNLTKILEATEQDPRDTAMITAKRFVRFRVVHPNDLALHRTWFERSNPLKGSPRYTALRDCAASSFERKDWSLGVPK